MTTVLASTVQPTTRAERVGVEGRAPLLLDILMGLSVLAGLSWCLTMEFEPRVPIGLTLGYLALVVAMAAIWVTRRFRERRSGHLHRVWAITFAALGTVGLFGADGAGAWPLFMMALLWTVDCFGPRSGVLLVSAVLVIQSIAFVATGRAAGDTVLQVAGSGYVFGFGLVLAWLLAEAVAAAARGELVIDPRVARMVVQRQATAADDPLAVLTRTERAVAEHLARGRTNAEIADAMVLAEGTVKNHVSSLLRKFGQRDRTGTALLLQSYFAGAGNAGPRR